MVESKDAPPADGANRPEHEGDKGDFQELLKTPLEQTFSAEQTLQLLTGFVNFIRRNQPEVWTQFSQGLLSFPNDPGSHFKPVLDTPQNRLEQAYQDAQNHLIQVRHATAQAIATQKQLEQQLQKNRDQADTWQNRTKMAREQHNQELEQQAAQREKQYRMAVEDLEQQLNTQSATQSELRQRLTEFEALVQKLYTRKQVLIARHKAAAATLKAHELISQFNEEEATATLDQIEDRIVELERQLPEKELQSKCSLPDDQQKLLAHTVSSLERAISVIERFESLLKKRGVTAASDDESSVARPDG